MPSIAARPGVNRKPRGKTWRGGQSPSQTRPILPSPESLVPQLARIWDHWLAAKGHGGRRDSAIGWPFGDLAAAAAPTPVTARSPQLCPKHTGLAQTPEFVTAGSGSGRREPGRTRPPLPRARVRVQAASGTFLLRIYGARKGGRGIKPTPPPAPPPSAPTCHRHAGSYHHGDPNALQPCPGGGGSRHSSARGTVTAREPADPWPLPQGAELFGDGVGTSGPVPASGSEPGCRAQHGGHVGHRGLLCSGPRGPAAGQPGGEEVACGHRGTAATRSGDGHAGREAGGGEPLAPGTSFVRHVRVSPVRLLPPSSRSCFHGHGAAAAAAAAAAAGSPAPSPASLRQPRARGRTEPHAHRPAPRSRSCGPSGRSRRPSRTRRPLWCRQRPRRSHGTRGRAETPQLRRTKPTVIVP